MAVESEFPLVARVINGCLAGLVGVVCVHPVDLVKTRLQNQQSSGSFVGNRHLVAYSGVVDCFTKTLRHEGFLGMYRGAVVNIVMISPEKAVQLVSNDWFRHRLATEANGSPGGSAFTEVLSGALAGLCQLVISTPRELLKIQLQDAGRSSGMGVVRSGLTGRPNPAQRVSAARIAAKLARTGGLGGLYKGGVATGLRDVTFSAVYFPLFAYLNNLGKTDIVNQKRSEAHQSFISGVTAGCVASFLVNPFDVVKTRLQTIRKGAGERHYHGITDCFRTVLATEGAAAFMKGVSARMLVIAPLFGIAQTVYYLEVADNLLKKCL